MTWQIFQCLSIFLLIVYSWPVRYRLPDFFYEEGAEGAEALILGEVGAGDREEVARIRKVRIRRKDIVSSKSCSRSQSSGGGRKGMALGSGGTDSSAEYLVINPMDKY